MAYTNISIDELKYKIKKNGWFFDEIEKLIDEIPISYLEGLIYNFSGIHNMINDKYIFNRTIEYYKKRLLKIGFDNMDRVLDAGAGMGHWSVALSSMNKLVDAIDINDVQIKIMNSLLSGMNVENCTIYNMTIDNLKFERECYDGIFCNGVIMFADVKKAISEFSRVLKKGGKMYIEYSSYGWYLDYILSRWLIHGDVVSGKTGIRYLFRMLLGYNSSIAIREKWFHDIIKSNNMKIVDYGGSSEVSINGNSKVRPMYPSKLYGLPAIREVVAIKI